MRDTSISIAKAIAIVMVVALNAGIPDTAARVILPLSVPIFFMTAGYCFSPHYFHDERTFVAHRLRRLYLPFLGWSLLFITLHNLLWAIGLINVAGGEQMTGAMHAYTFSEYCQRIWSITFCMSGYDIALCSPFWFFRALLVASLAFLLGMKVLQRFLPQHRSEIHAAILLGIVLFLGLWQVGMDLSVPALGTGHRELMGTGLFSLGFLARRYCALLTTKVYYPLAGLGALILSAILFPATFPEAGTLSSFASLWLPAAGGFIFLLFVCTHIAKAPQAIVNALTYIGDRTLYIFAFHVTAFMLVSLIKVIGYGLPWQAMGGHPVVLHNSGDAFWLLYTIVGVGLPLLCREGFHWLGRRIDLSAKACLGYTIDFLFLTGRYCIVGIVWLAKAIARVFMNIWRALTDMVKASNPNEE